MAEERDASLQELGQRFERSSGRPQFKQKESEGGQYELKKLRSQHREIIRLHVLGWKNKEIAEALDCTPACVSYTLNGDLAKERIKYMQKQLDGRAMDIRGAIQEIAPVALEALEDILLDPNAKDKDKSVAARDILDRAGHGAVDRVDVRAHVTRQDIDDIKQRAASAAHVVDAKFEDIPSSEEEEDQAQG